MPAVTCRKQGAGRKTVLRGEQQSCSQKYMAQVPWWHEIKEKKGGRTALYHQVWEGSDQTANSLLLG